MHSSSASLIKPLLIKTFFPLPSQILPIPAASSTEEKCSWLSLGSPQKQILRKGLESRSFIWEIAPQNTMREWGECDREESRANKQYLDGCYPWALTDEQSASESISQWAERLDLCPLPSILCWMRVSPKVWTPLLFLCDLACNSTSSKGARQSPHAGGDR